MIKLTRPDGTLVWVNPRTIVSVTSSGPADRGNAAIRIGGASVILFVRETPEEVVEAWNANL